MYAPTQMASALVAYAADHATLNATFKSSGDNLSITTYTTTDNRLVVHLWIAASCLEAHKWLLFPGATRIYDVTRGDRVPIPLHSFLQYHPGVMRPGSSGVAAEVGYLDRGSPLECHGRTVAAASATFAIDSATRQLAVSLRDVVRDDSGAPLQVPDVSLTLTVENERNDREGVPILLAPIYGWGR